MALPLFIFLLLATQGALLGLSDDEAYYWVLAQNPSFGYAFHPPAVAWIIALFQNIFGGWFGEHSPFLVRLPAALSVAGVLGVGLEWLTSVGVSSTSINRCGWVLLSFFGFFSLGWMMVPDIPLFLSLTLLFSTTWTICFREPKSKHFWTLAISAFWVVLSKYSGVLALASSLGCLFLWAPSFYKFRGIKYLTLGFLIALCPIVIWNSSHHWVSILYQIRDRHLGSIFSWNRYLRFWLVELILAGPFVLYYFLVIVWKCLRERRQKTRIPIFSFITIWMMPPALLFCIQPAFSDFKPHWVFVAWWPVVLGLALAAQGLEWRWIRYQVLYGLTLGFCILLSCHFPLLGWISQLKQAGSEMDPRMDVTNDLYGWKKLAYFIKNEAGLKGADLPIVGSRYQTASQAAFALGDLVRVTLLPRDLRETHDWPNIHISKSLGPAWPELLRPVLYVTDNRYSSRPEFPGAVCKKNGRYEVKRFNLTAKTIEVWRCDP